MQLLCSFGGCVCNLLSVKPLRRLCEAVSSLGRRSGRRGTRPVSTFRASHDARLNARHSAHRLDGPTAREACEAWRIGSTARRLAKRAKPGASARRPDGPRNDAPTARASKTWRGVHRRGVHRRDGKTGYGEGRADPTPRRADEKMKNEKLKKKIMAKRLICSVFRRPTSLACARAYINIRYATHYFSLLRTMFQK